MNAMLRPLDELHERRRRCHQEAQVLSAKMDFAERLDGPERQVEWLGSLGLLLPRPPLSRHYRVACSHCGSIRGLYARDDEDAAKVLGQCGWALHEETEHTWLCQRCGGLAGCPITHLRKRFHRLWEFG